MTRKEGNAVDLRQSRKRSLRGIVPSEGERIFELAAEQHAGEKRIDVFLSYSGIGDPRIARQRDVDKHFFLAVSDAADIDDRSADAVFP